MAYQHEILLDFPLVFGLVGVEVVEPPLPALLGSPEVLPVGTDVELLSEFAPLVLAVLVPRSCGWYLTRAANSSS